MRVYLPATFDTLASLAADGQFPVAGGWGFAVTPALTEFFSAGGDEEEIAHSAFTDAARASLRLLVDGAQRFPQRRVVITVDLADERVALAPTMGESVVEITPAVVSAEDIVAFHVDVADNEETTAAAVAVINDAELGDEDAELRVGDALDRFLAWYAPSELGLLVAVEES